jgi:peptidase S41-like protein/tricorn protease-like protein
MKNKFFLFIIIVLAASACEKAFIEKAPNASDRLAVFDEFWKIFNEKYAMFEFKGVDWEALKEQNRPKINENTTDEELFEIMGDMVIALRDAHSNLSDLERDTIKSFDILAGFPTNFDIRSITNYIDTTNLKFIGKGILYEMLPDNIGYMWIQSFDVEITDADINEVLGIFKDTKGLIIDVRQNTGGDPSGAARLASHLTDKEAYLGFERFKTGPASGDFSDSDIDIRPASGELYTKPIAVLTDRFSYSATTTFIYYTNPLVHVSFIGGRTGGGSGSTADGFLSNGWSYSLSTSEFIDWEGRHLDDGFDPDIMVNLDTTDLTKDEIIERAIEELQ